MATSSVPTISPQLTILEVYFKTGYDILPKFVKCPWLQVYLQVYHQHHWCHFGPDKAELVDVSRIYPVEGWLTNGVLHRKWRSARKLSPLCKLITCIMSAKLILKMALEMAFSTTRETVLITVMRGVLCKYSLLHTGTIWGASKIF